MIKWLGGHLVSSQDQSIARLRLELISILLSPCSFAKSAFLLRRLIFTCENKGRV